jgi:hypothetical protein
VCDPEQPRRGWRATRPVAPAGQEHGGEHLRGEIRGELGVTDAAQEIGQHGPLVAAVEGGERFGVICRGGQQLIVARRLHPTA